MYGISSTYNYHKHQPFHGSVKEKQSSHGSIYGIPWIECRKKRGREDPFSDQKPHNRTICANFMIPSWWLNHPVEKYVRQNELIFPKDRGENKKCLKSPPRYILEMANYLIVLKHTHSANQSLSVPVCFRHVRLESWKNIAALQTS